MYVFENDKVKSLLLKEISKNKIRLIKKGYKKIRRFKIMI